ncbi:MAG: M56 family metallopeptidase [Pseudomonadota bacterium]
MLSLPIFDLVESGALLALLVKGTLLCLLGVSLGSESSAMPAIVRHRIALGTVSCLAALPLLAVMLSSWELPILPREAAARDTNASLLIRLLTLVYLGVAAILLTRLCLDVLRIARLSGRARAVDTAARLLPGLDHPRGNTPVRYSEEIRSPLTWGWLRPQVLVPQDASGWKANELFMVLHHELAHVQRMDWAGHVVARCVHALYWPVPGIRLLLRQLSLSSEQACDDRVLATGVAAPQYAAMLLRQAQGHRVPATVPLAHSTELGTRIRYLVVEIVDHSAFARGTAATFFTCFALTLAVATAQLGQRPELPVIAWGSVEPSDAIQVSTFPRHAVAVDAAVLAVLEPGPARPLPLPAPLKPPRLEPLEKPTVPPPRIDAPLP